MYDHHINEMARAVAEKAYPIPETEDKVVQAHHDLLYNQAKEAIAACWVDKIALTWIIDDVQAVVHDAGRKITKEQAGFVLERVLSKHDASIGVNWETLRIWSDSLLDEEGEPVQWEKDWEPDDA